jgi:magnesium chelatase family protein
MLAAIRSAAVLGIDAYDVTVEVDVASGLPQWMIVGLPSGAVKESRERVMSALTNSGFPLPSRRVTVNLSPANVRKDGTGFDLPIAIGLLVAIGVIPDDAIRGRVFIGELGLDGTIRGVRGALSVARHLTRDTAQPTLVLPLANVGEAGLVRSIPLAALPTFSDLVEAIQGESLPPPPVVAPRPPDPDDGDFSEVVGQETAKRALEIAAAGSHACLLIGPPGAGKTMLARRLPSILPALTEEEALEVTAIHSVAGLLPESGTVLATRPFRAPHHSISSAGLVGGGGNPRPGEASLAHHGVLFLDELLEFPRGELEALRQPLEDGRVVIARASLSVMFPARFALVAAMNPCPCCYAGHPTRPCICTLAEIVKYRARLSGALADRIDMHVTLGAVPPLALQHDGGGETSASVRARVERSREMQRHRFRHLPSVTCNAHASGRWLLAHGAIDSEAREMLGTAMESLNLSARAYHRVLRVSRTIADLEMSTTVSAAHVAEALRYRPTGGERAPAARAS